MTYQQVCTHISFFHISWLYCYLIYIVIYYIYITYCFLLWLIQSYSALLTMAIWATVFIIHTAQVCRKWCHIPLFKPILWYFHCDSVCIPIIKKCMARTTPRILCSTGFPKATLLEQVRARRGPRWCDLKVTVVGDYTLTSKRRSCVVECRNHKATTHDFCLSRRRGPH